MIHLILLDRAACHICDIVAADLLNVADSYKKNATSEQAGSRNVHC